MASKKTIYLSDPAEAVIGEVESLSGRINNIVIRYGGIVAAECPVLALAEWQMICDMLNGTVIDADYRDADPARFLWADIAESGRLDGLAEKWGIDTEALSARVRAMPYSQQCAILEVVAKFWRSPRLNETPMPELLKECGAKFTN
jgi:hypothetical protein